MEQQGSQESFKTRPADKESESRISQQEQQLQQQLQKQIRIGRKIAINTMIRLRIFWTHFLRLVTLLLCGFSKKPAETNTPLLRPFYDYKTAITDRIATESTEKQSPRSTSKFLRKRGEILQYKSSNLCRKLSEFLRLVI